MGRYARQDRFNASRRGVRASLGAGEGGGGDPYWENVSFLLSADGLTHGSQAITDLSGGAALNIANVAVDTSVAAVGSGSFKFLNTTARSIYRESSSVDWLKKDEDWTVECFLRQNSLTGNGIAGAWDWTNDNTGRSWIIYVSNAGVLTFVATNVATSADTIISTAAPCNTTGVFNHIVVQNNSDSIEMYVDGSLVNIPRAIGVAPQTPGTPTFVVGGSHDVPTNDLDGYMDQLRITKGVARYSDGYTVPTEPFPTS